MEGTYSNEGLADDAAPRRRSGRPGARNAGAPAGKGGVYVVKPGDTLGKIACRHHISVKALRDANKLDPKRDKFLRAGQKLIIPGGKAAAPGAKAAPGGKTAPGKKAAAGRPANAPKLNSDGTYTMVRGDTIPKVARKFGVRAKALQQANNLSDEDTTKLQIGHKLVIPTGSDAQAKAAPKGKARTAKKAQAPKKAAAASEQAPAKPETETPPPPPAAENTSASAAPAPALPPAAQVDSAAQSESSSFVRVGDAKTLEEFAARNNTTTAELLRLNPSLDPAAPLKSDDMLFVPKK